MHKTFFSIFIVFFLFPIGTVHAQQNSSRSDGFYIGGFFGAAILEDPEIIELGGGPIPLNTIGGWDVGGAIGYRFNSFRIEGELAYSSNEINKLELSNTIVNIDADANALSYLVNIYYDFDVFTSATPYIFAGIGGVTIDVEDSEAVITTESGSSLAYKFGTGIEGDVAVNMGWYLGYSYFTASEFTAINGPILGSHESDYTWHTVNVGIRYYY